ncbi:MAG: hypothetical protein Q8O93_05160 [bacterium]|nr:hypothetical protein [bacterium]
MNNPLSPTLAERMFKDRSIRIAITRQSHLFFFHFYFAHYVKYETAHFQKEIFHLSERTDIKNLFVVAFRGSAKSTILTMSYPIWAILGEQEKKFVLILCQTRTQAKQHMMNLKRELEGNQLLQNDLGPFQEESDEWGASSLVFSNLNARITAASSEQSIRGTRHHQYRPDIIICDDVEDLASVKTRESRQKTYQWLTGEVIPAGDRNTRLVIVGNLLHEDSLIMRLKSDVEEKRIDGIFKAYPLFDKDDNVAWPGKYPNAEAIKDEKLKSGNDIAWQREYLLRIVSDTDRVVHPEWIRYYNSEEKPWENFHLIDYAGVDLAISTKNGADYTAIVILKICRSGDKTWAYVEPYPFNERITFPEQVKKIKMITSINGDRFPKIFIEKVAYQEALIQQLKSGGLHVEGVSPHGDKRERLALTTSAIKEGLIIFPKKGAEELITQLIGFGVEKHDDLADAFSIVVNQFIIFANKPRPRIILL